jgi:hypothetical protein
VNLAISDPAKPGRFLLGIECDGAQFHSSRSARDRDRLRQQVLEAHGWIIHRVWSADWYLRAQAEMKKVEEAIAAARAEWDARDEDGFKPARAVPLSFEAERLDGVDLVTAVVGASRSSKPLSLPYVEADFSVNRLMEPHETSLGQMVEHVAKIIEVEGPIHLDEIAARIRILWGLGRAGSRIRAAVERAVSVAVRSNLAEGGPFYTKPGLPVSVRDRSVVKSATLRKPEMLPPAEVEKAILGIVEANYGAARDELVQSTSRVLGFSATSAQLRIVLSAGIDRLLQAGALVMKGDMLAAPSK